MFWKISRKPAALTAALLFTICFAGLAQPEKLAISKFQVLNDFYTNPALLGYWGRPAFGLIYSGALVKQQTPLNSVDAFYNQRWGNYGAGLELSRSEEWFLTNTSAKLGMSRHFTLSKTSALSLGASVKYTSTNYDFGGFTFPDQIEPFYGFVRSTNEVPFDINRSVLTADFGASLQTNRYLLAVYGENIAPILAKENDEEAMYFDSKSYDYLPARINALFIYQFNLGKYFILSPGAKFRYEFPAPEPWVFGHLNFQFRDFAMIDYSYEIHGLHQLMVGGRIKDKVSLNIGAASYQGNFSPYYSEKLMFHLSVLTQL